MFYACLLCNYNGLLFVKIAQIAKLKHTLYVIINYYASFIEHVEGIGHADSFMAKRLFKKEHTSQRIWNRL